MKKITHILRKLRAVNFSLLTALLLCQGNLFADDPVSTVDDDNIASEFSLLDYVKVEFEERYKTVSSTSNGYNPATGEITFAHTDISLPGNSNLPVELSRWIPSGDFDTGGPTGWHWNLPFIQGNYMDMFPGHTEYGNYWNWGSTNWHFGNNC